MKEYDLNLYLIGKTVKLYLSLLSGQVLPDFSLFLNSLTQSNYLVFMAELFWWFEVVKPSFVQPRVVRPQGGSRCSWKQNGEFIEPPLVIMFKGILLLL